MTEIADNPPSDLKPKTRPSYRDSLLITLLAFLPITILAITTVVVALFTDLHPSSLYLIITLIAFSNLFIQTIMTVKIAKHVTPSHQLTHLRASAAIIIGLIMTAIASIVITASVASTIIYILVVAKLNQLMFKDLQDSQLPG